MVRRTIVLSVTIGCLVLAAAVLASGTAAADEAVLDEMDGDGSADDPYVITDVAELQAMNEDLEAHYVLGEDIDASETEAWNAGAGFDPVGEDHDSPFTGSFDGDGHDITDLTVDRPGEDNVGLFGESEGKIEDVRMIDADVRGLDAVGTAAGSHDAEMADVFSSGTVDGEYLVGGLVGFSDEGGPVTESASTANVKGESNVGGLFGTARRDVTNSYATGDVEVDSGEGGGLIGSASGGPVRNTYATGDVAGADANRVGGLIGTNHIGVSQSYSTGSVEGSEYNVGGLVGYNRDNTYNGRIVDAHWDVDASGMSEGEGGDEVLDTGLSTREMTGSAAEANMALDFENYWTATDEYPILQWQVEDVDLSLSSSTVAQGESVEATVALELNDGSTVTATETAAYDAGGIASVDAGTVTTSEQGSTRVTATVAGESDAVDLDVVEPPNIELVEADLAADAVVDGSKMAISATYENTGGPGTEAIDVTADGDVVASDSAFVDSGDEVTVDFEWETTGSAGEAVDVALDGESLGTLEIVDAGTVTLEDAAFPDTLGSGTSYEYEVSLDTDQDRSVVDTVTYTLDDEVVTTEPVAAEPGGSTTTLEHDGTSVAPGLTVVHGVSLGGEEVTGTSDVVEPASFEIVDVDAPDERDTGAPTEVTVEVENTGGVEGDQAVAVELDGETVATESVSVDGGATASVTVEFDAPDGAGEHDLTVATDDDEETATLAVAASDGLPGFGVTVAVIALVIGASLARRRV